MEKVESLPPADLHFQNFPLGKIPIQAFFLDFSASTARLLDTFSMSVIETWKPRIFETQRLRDLGTSTRDKGGDKAFPS